MSVERERAKQTPPMELHGNNPAAVVAVPVAVRRNRSLASIGTHFGHRLGRFLPRPSPQGARLAVGHPATVEAEIRIPHTTVPAPPHDAGAESAHARQMADLPSVGPLDMLLVGDSLAQHWPGSAWNPWSTFSLGVGGDLTQHVLWRLDRIEWRACRPRRILIVAGTNNLLFGETAPDIAAGIDAIAARLDAAHPKAELYVLLPPPFGFELRRAAAERRALKDLLTARFGRRLIDADGVMAGSDRAAASNYQGDFVHFTDRGYDLLSGAVRASCGLRRRVH